MDFKLKTTETTKTPAGSCNNHRWVIFERRSITEHRDTGHEGVLVKIVFVLQCGICGDMKNHEVDAASTNSQYYL